MRNIDVWYARMDFDDVLDEAERSVSVGARRAAAKARKDSSRALARLTEMVDGRHRIISAPPLIERVDLLPEVDARGFERMQALLDTYAASLPDDLRRLVSSYRFVNMARKVVSVGSVSTRAWIILLEGRDGADPLVLQAKEAEASVLEEHVEETRTPTTASASSRASG